MDERFSPSRWDRLMRGRHSTVDGGTATPLTLEQLKSSLARDLEALLNTRLASTAKLVADYPDCAASLLNYGLIDFAGLCLSSSEDRKRICAALKAAVEAHEPRLSDVRASLHKDGSGVNRLNFVISGRLRLASLLEPVSFDALLQPSTLSYSIRHLSWRSIRR